MKKPEREETLIERICLITFFSLFTVTVGTLVLLFYGFIFFVVACKVTWELAVFAFSVVFNHEPKEEKNKKKLPGRRFRP